LSLVLPLAGAVGRLAVTESLPDGDGTVIGEDDAEDLAQPAQEPPP
jgi:hypothetical protein